jgi:cytochrome c peroxidase
MPACRAIAVAASTKPLPAAVLGFAAILGLGGSSVRADDPFYGASFEKPPAPAAMAAVGRSLFFDPSLSASGKLACATCHDPAHAFGPPDALPVRRGGADNARPGVRAVPSLTYAQNAPPFTEHFFDSEGDDSADQGPAGGRNWDGRAQSAHDQARVPLLSPFEMANASPQAVAAKVRRASYEAQFRDTFGPHVFDDAARVYKGVLLALETYQQTPLEFYPYTSKYDAYLRGEASLTEKELRGLAAFDDPARGNCARCHPSAVSGGAFPQFTDFGYAALGAPRNAAIPANGDPRYFDLGLCGPLRTDLADRPEYCGRFRTPSLRNVAVRRVFFHNGVFHQLEDVVRFYAQRDTDPQNWYPRAPDGSVMKFDDLPARYRRNVDEEPPFDRPLGGRPAMSEADIQDIVAFLNTLTDGFVRNAPRASFP